MWCALVLTSIQGVTAPETQIELDVPYRTVGGAELALDAYLPAGEGPHPAILCIHGGAWIAGDKRDMREFCERFVDMGYAAFTPAYRLAPDDHYPAQIEDCLYAVQFVRANAERFHVDPERIGALGLSAGGHLVELLAVLDDRRDEASADPVLRESTRIQCVVPYFAPSVLTLLPTYDFDTTPPPELFGDVGTAEDYARASPLHHVTKDDPPFLLVHGDADDTVNFEHSVVIEEALREAGVACELFRIEGGGHGDFFRRDPGGAYWRRTVDFLAEHLEPGPADKPLR